MRRSGASWAAGVIAPWCLGVALLVSITADAGQNATIGGSRLPIASRALAEPAILIPPLAVRDEFDRLKLERFAESGRKRFAAAISDGTTQDDASLEQASPDEQIPRSAMKPGKIGLPIAEESRKGDPVVNVRPVVSQSLRHHAGLVGALWLGQPDEAMPSASFSLDDKGNPLDGASSFSPYAEGETMQDEASSTAAGATILMRSAALKERLLQGATPRVPRAVALSSTTPAPADGPPVAAIFPVRPPMADATIVPRSDHPDYAALLSGERGARERKCLAEAVYFEARSEPEEGQAAVAQVVLNRATSGLYPASICGTVYQNRSHFHACQFSFACDGRSLRVREPEAWRTAVRIADSVIDGKTYVSDVGGATHYHANYVRPSWSRRLVKMDVIGHHIFYKLRHG